MPLAIIAGLADGAAPVRVLTDALGQPHPLVRERRLYGAAFIVSTNYAPLPIALDMWSSLPTGVKSKGTP